MGHEFSGIIEALGRNVDSLSIGDRVAVIPHLVCGKCDPCKQEIYNFCEKLRCTGAEADGAHAQYICMPANMVLQIPDNMTLEDAAMVEPACVAYHGARRGDLTDCDTVLIVGSGPIGLFCVQCCKALGAKRALIADLDATRLSLALSLGADGIIDVSKETLADGLSRLAGSPQAVDVFYDCVGEKGRALDTILQLARRGSRVVMIGVLQTGYDIPHLPDFVQHELRLSGTTMYVPQDYRDMIALLSAGKVQTVGMITHTFSLSEIQKVFDIIETGDEPFVKIMLTVNE
jgi:L-iditol 2-dehydrogenase